MLASLVYQLWISVEQESHRSLDVWTSEEPHVTIFILDVFTRALL